MKKSNLLIYLTLGIFYLNSCSNSGFEIKGTITGIPDSTRIYVRNMNSDSTLDSSYVINSQFVLKGDLKQEVEHLWLGATIDDKYTTTNLFIGNEKITVTGDVNDFKSKKLNITGSKIQDDYTSLLQETDSLDLRKKSLILDYNRNYQILTNDQKTEHTKKIEDIKYQTLEVKENFIKRNSGAYYSIIELFYSMRHFSRDTLTNMLKLFPENLKQTKYGKAIQSYISNPSIQNGDILRDFTTRDLNGNEHRISDVKKKYILLTFCKPGCVYSDMALQQLNKVNETHSDSIEIVTFFVTSNKNLWKNEVDKFNVNWLSVSDTQGKFSDIAIKYNVYAYPTTVLINNERKIIDWTNGCGQGYFNWYLKNAFKNI